MRGDLGVSQWLARVAERFIRSGLLDRHIESVVELYRTKREVAERAVAPRSRDLGKDLGSIPLAEFVERLVADAHLMGRTVLAAIDDAGVPACFTHLAVMAEGRLVASGPADPVAFPGRTWTRRIECPGRAADAVRLIGPLVEEAAAVDESQLTCRHDPARGAFADVIIALVRAGMPVEAAAFDPPWPAQLVG